MSTTRRYDLVLGLVALPFLPLLVPLAALMAVVDVGRAALARRRYRRYLRRRVGLELLVATSKGSVEPLVYEHVIPALPDVALVYLDERRVWSDLPADVTTHLLREWPSKRYPLVARVGAGGVVSWKSLREDVLRCRRSGAPELLGALAARKLRSLKSER